MDLFVWDDIPEAFLEQIERDHVVLSEKKSFPASERWREFSLGELTDNFDYIRVPVKRADRRSGPHPYYGASGIVDYVDDYLFDGEFLLIAEDGENLRTRNTPIAFLAEGKFWVNNHAHIVQGNHRANTRFLMYALSNLDVSGYLTGSTMPKLTQDNLNRILLHTPPLYEQEAIAHILGTLDDKIELNRRMNETLEAMARALFKSWFVDFDPVHPKIEGRDNELESQIYDLFPTMFDDEGYPLGWVVRPLGKFFEILSGGTPKTTENDYWNGEIPWFSVVDTPAEGSVFVVETKKNITQNGLKNSAANLVPSGTTIVTARGTVGNLAIAATEMAFNQSCYGLRHNKHTGEYFVYLVVQHMVRQLRAMAHGSVFSTITRQTFQTVSLVMPPSQVLMAFEETVKPIFHLIRANVHESNALIKIRNLLLPKLISGELCPRRSERLVEAIS